MIDLILEESLIIRKIIHEIPIPKNVLDIGSSTHKYRTVTQPYIDKNIFQPLRNMDAEITYLDLEKGDGIDIAADISSKFFSLPNQYDLVLCTSLLQYVTDIKTTIINISSTVRNGGYLIITAPLIFPYHDPPLDTLNRYSPDDISKLFTIHPFETKYIDIIRKKLSQKKWLMLTFESFLLIFKWRFISGLLQNMKQCLSREVKFSIVLLRAKQGRRK